MRIIEPLFPGYIFIRCNLAQCYDQIRYTSGISSLVHFGHNIPTVPTEVVEELRQYFEAGETLDLEDGLKEGAEVTVAEGAFLGSRGIVVRLRPAKQRVQILLDLLGRTTVAEMDCKSLTVENRCLAKLIPALAMSAGLNR